MAAVRFMISSNLVGCSTGVAELRAQNLVDIARLPTMLGLREYVDPAGLMSYGPHIPDLFCRTAGQPVPRS